MRPFGALVFGRLGDLIGRKYTFLVTILIMGASTFIVGLLPSYATIGIAAPVILISLRILQGLALGGEYGGAATYVAEHAPQGKRGFYTAWIQTTATARPVPVAAGDPRHPHSRSAKTPSPPGAGACRSWSRSLLLGISVWIRLQMNEVAGLPEDEGRRQDLEGAAVRGLRPAGRTPRSPSWPCSA